MTPLRWQQTEELYHAALGCEQGEREALLARADPELRREVESLLAQQSRATPLDHPAWEGAASLLGSTVASLTPGTRLGPYKIEGPLGSGGMGEVFRAVDTRLARPVAIKTSQVQFNARFEREARAISSLNHPHICTLFDVGPNYLVMELCEGETLAARLKRGKLSIQDTLHYGQQIADALAAAHSLGIIHRDLKPGNIMLTKNGVKVLDFGLAKSPEDEVLTASRVVMGTPAYMAPEQALGQELDARADLFSLGVVMYEMATGKRPFQGDTSMATTDAILHKAPTPPSQSNPSIPVGLEQVIENALEKDRDMRYQTATGILADLKRLLRDMDRQNDSGRRVPVPTPVVAPRHRRLYFAAAGMLIAAISGGVVWRWMMTRELIPSATPAIMRLTSDTGLTIDPALSADGKLVAYASDRASGDNLDIWVQQVSGGAPLRLTSDPTNESGPSFSPDGSRIVFRSERDGGGIYILSALGGESRLIAKGGLSPRFSPDGSQIAYVTGKTGGLGTGSRGGLFVAPSIGGMPRRLVPDEIGAADPVWSPDGRFILFATGRYRVDDWAVIPSDLKSTNQLAILKLAGFTKSGLADLTPCQWLAGDRILFSAKSGDSSHVFEIGISRPATSSKQWRLADSPKPLTFGTSFDQSASIAVPAGSPARMAFASVIPSENIWSLALDADHPRPSGKLQQVTQGSGFRIFPSISSDGTKMVFLSHAAYNDEVWLLDFTTAKSFQVSTKVSAKFATLMHSDGSQAIYEDGLNEIYAVSFTGGAPEKLCEQCYWPWDWSSDHKRILHLGAESGNPWMGTRMANLATGKNQVFMAQPGLNLYQVHWSPEGRWIVFMAVSKPDQSRLYVAPVSGDQGPSKSAWIPITDGSTFEGWPLWSPDGKWIYARSDRDGYRCLWAIPLDPQTKKPAGEPVAIFHSHGARVSLRNADEVSQGVSLAKDKIVFNQGEITGNIWMTELPDR